jgi:DNA-binding response OmpR family regulator
MTISKNKIIIVDDDEDLLKLLATSFKAQGFDVKTFATGKEGMSYLLIEKNLKEASLIILDRMLPDMDGLDILKTLHEKTSLKVPVLILSILSSEKDVLSGLKKGAVDYVSKPFSLPIFMQKALSLIKG